MMNKIIVAVLLLLSVVEAFAQPADNSNIKIDYAAPRQYEIAEITVSGVKYLNQATLVSMSGRRVGQNIDVPGDDITKPLNKLWKH